MEQKKISKSVLKRLPGYLAYLKNMPENAPMHISATALANAIENAINACEKIPREERFLEIKVLCRPKLARETATLASPPPKVACI